MDRLTTRGLTLSLKASGLTKGTTSTYTTTATTEGFINGKHVTGLAAQTNTATPTTDVATGAAFVALTDNQATVLVIGQNLAGAIKMCQGTIEATEVGVTTTAGAFLKAPQFPSLPDDFMPLGYLLVRTAPSASDFTAGTSSWTATGITASAVVEVAVLPDRPQTS
tara:strand:+ start:247 stop:744 length:498 start_codon:yes stop_codon:yes gene_type:complete